MMVDTNALIRDIRAAVKEAEGKLAEIKELPRGILQNVDQSFARNKMCVELDTRLIQLEEGRRAETAFAILPLKIQRAALMNYERVNVFTFDMRPDCEYHRRNLSADSIAALVYDVCDQAGLNPVIEITNLWEGEATVYITNLNV